MRLVPDRPNSELYSVLVVCAFGLFVKTVLWWFTLRYNQEAIWLQDSEYYHRLALLILKGGLPAVARLPVTLAVAHRPIGYPLFLAGLYALFGVKPMLVSAAQILLSSGAVLLTYRIGCEEFDRRTAVLGALLLSLDPASITSALFLLSDTLFAVLLLLGLLLLIRGLKGKGDTMPHRVPSWSLILAGGVLSLATFVRPISYYLLPLLGLAVLLLSQRKAGLGWCASFGRFGAFLALPVLLIGGTQVRQLARTGYAGFSDLEGINMLFYRAAGVISLAEQGPHPLSLSHWERGEGRGSEAWDFHDAQHSLGFGHSADRPYGDYFAIHPDAAGLSGPALSSRWLQEGRAIIRQHPGAALRLELRSVAQLLLDPASLELGRFLGTDLLWLSGTVTAQAAGNLGRLVTFMWQEHRFDAILAVLGLMFLCAVYVTAALGTTGREMRNWSSGRLLLAATVVYFIAVSAGPEASSRFRVPVMPLIVLFSSAFLRDRWREPKSSPTAIARGKVRIRNQEA